MNKTSLLTILLSLGRVLYNLDATFDTWSVLASTLSCSVTSDWRMWTEIHHFANFRHSHTALASPPTTER